MIIQLFPAIVTHDPHLDPLRGRISSICRIVAIASVAWFVWVTGLTLWFWTHRADYVDKSARFYGVDPTTISDSAYLCAGAAAVPGFAATAYFVVALWRLLQGYRDGDIFTIAAAEKLRALGVAGLVATAVDVLTQFTQLATLSLQLLGNVPFWNWLPPTDLLYALLCGFILALAAIFRTAAEIADDHSQIV